MDLLGLGKAVAIIGGSLGYFETRLSRKVSKDALEGQTKQLNRLETRLMLIEQHLIGKALDKETIEQTMKKNGWGS